MAPKKRKAEEQSAKPSAPAASRRVTRSASQRDAKGSAGTPAVELSKNKNENKKGKAKAAGKQAKAKAEEKEEAKEKAAGGGATKTVVIEHCKQCNSFKKSATELKKRLEEAVPGITVLLNRDKPQKGCFEIREEGGETFIRLLVKPMKAPDMNKVISDIANKIK